MLRTQRKIGIIKNDMKTPKKTHLHAILTRVMQEIMQNPIDAEKTKVKNVLTQDGSEFAKAFQTIIEVAASANLATMERIEAHIPSYQRHKSNFVNEYKDRFGADVEINDIKETLNEWLIEQVQARIAQKTGGDNMDVDACADLLANTLTLTTPILSAAPNWRKKGAPTSTAPQLENSNQDIMSPTHSHSGSPILPTSVVPQSFF